MNPHMNCVLNTSMNIHVQLKYYLECKPQELTRGITSTDSELKSTELKKYKTPLPLEQLKVWLMLKASLQRQYEVVWLVSNRT